MDGRATLAQGGAKGADGAPQGGAKGADGAPQGGAKGADGAPQGGAAGAEGNAGAVQQAPAFLVAPHDAGDGAIAAFPYDRMTVERFRQAFPRARWRGDLGAWFVPGTRAERRLTGWMGREWSGVLAFADQRGRDAFDFAPIESPYLATAEDGFVVRTPFSRSVVAALRDVPWARWDPAAKAWRVPFRAFEELARRWPAIEDAARHAEPEARRQRAEGRKASPDEAGRRAESQAWAAERRRHRYPVPADAPPPLGQVLMTHAGPMVIEEIAGEVVDPAIAARFYRDVAAGPATLVWASWRRPSHEELVRAWPARTPPTAPDLARGWWQGTIEVMREERHRAASLQRARTTRSAAKR